MFETVHKGKGSHKYTWILFKSICKTGHFEANCMGIWYLLLKILRFYVFKMAANGGRHFEINMKVKNYETQYISIHVIRLDIVGTYRYWAPKYESRPTDRNSRYIWIQIFRFCQKLKLVFPSSQALALSKFTTGTGNRTLLVFRNR